MGSRATLEADSKEREVVVVGDDEEDLALSKEAKRRLKEGKERVTERWGSGWGAAVRTEKKRGAAGSRPGQVERQGAEVQGAARASLPRGPPPSHLVPRTEAGLPRRSPNSRKNVARKEAPSPERKGVRLMEASQVREERRLQGEGGESSGESSKDMSACSQWRKKQRKRRVEEESARVVPGRQKRQQESHSESAVSLEGQQGPRGSRRARSPERKKGNPKKERKRLSPKPKRKAEARQRAREASQVREAKRLQGGGGESCDESSKGRSACSQRRKKKKVKRAEEKSVRDGPGRQKRQQESNSESAEGLEGQQGPSGSRRARSPERQKRNHKKERKRRSPKPKRRTAEERRAREREAEEPEVEERSPTQERQREQDRELGLRELVDGLSKKGKRELLKGMDPRSSPPREGAKKT